MDQSANEITPAAKENLITRMSKTRFNYWAEFFLDLPIGVFLMWLGLRSTAMKVGPAVFCIASGLLFFSLFEYCMHRWVFHGPDSIFSKGHDAHHQNPMGYDALPFFLPAVIALAVVGFLTLLMPRNFAYLFAGVAAIGYITYGLSHFANHHVRFHRKFAVRWASNHRIHHHHPDKNFGVTTPLWDFVLGTKWVSTKNGA